MEVAIIPPICLLDMADPFKYQLMLPHMMANEVYSRDRKSVV